MKLLKLLTSLNIFCITFLCISHFSSPYYANTANTNSKAIIITNVNDIIYKKELSLRINVSLYNIDDSNNLFLSYHIIDPITEEIIQFENKREPLLLDDSKEATLDLYLNVNNYMNNHKTIKIIFDIVDITNSSWFSSNPSIVLETSSLEFRSNPLANIRYNIQEHFDVFIFNIIFCIISIFVYFKTRCFFKF